MKPLNDTLNIVALTLICVSTLAVAWSTLFQEKLPYEIFQFYLEQYGWKAFLVHTSAPGSVCWFGVATGVFIVSYTGIQIWKVIECLQKGEDARDTLKILLISSIVVNVIIFFAMLFANSYVAHAYRGNARIGLFDQTLPFFVCQFVAIPLLWKNI